MAQTPEGRVKDRVKDLLRAHGAYWFMPVQGGRGAPGLDFHCAHYGRAFFIETKAGNGKMTPRQKATAEKMRQNGEVFLVNDDPTTLSELKEWLQRTSR